MEGRYDGEVVRVGDNARERFYDSRGYGTPDGEGVVLSPVEAAHLLYRGDLDSVDGQPFAAFLGNAGVLTSFLVYKDLRDRGFYVSVVTDEDGDAIDFLVHPRGEGPWGGAVEHRVRVTDERETIELDELGDVVLGIVDEESEITYLETDTASVSGRSQRYFDTEIHGELFGDRVVCWNPPAVLHNRSFYGQPMDDDGTALQLSLTEAVYLARRGVLEIDVEAVIERGRGIEGQRFDRRLTVYRRLRERGLVPKTGFKFGADFRAYTEVEDVENLGHSELLIRVLPNDGTATPREIALDVRLAHGVRKRMVFALVGEEIRWLSVGRLTP
ncbi:MAG: tRNA-intron lyase [Natronomonas sp.]